MHKLIILLFVCSFFTFKALSQKSDSTRRVKQFYLGVHVGTMGLGIQAVKPVAKFLTLRGVCNYLEVKKSFVKSSSTYDEYKDINVLLKGAGLILDWRVSADNDGFFISTGAYYNLTKVSQRTEYIYTANDANKNLGDLTVEFTTTPVVPYIGILFFKYHPKRRVSTALELGTFYIGKPKVLFIGNGAVAPTAEQDDIIRSNVSKYNYYPYCNIHINFRLTK